MAEPRKGEVTMKGNPIDLIGPKLQAGEPAPDFSCVDTNLGSVSLKDSSGKVRLFSVVPSLDTPVCSIQTKRFSEEVNKLGDQVAAFTVSLDLPFAMKRFCSDNKIENLVNLSDAHDHSFGEHYGVLISGLPIPLLARAIFVVDAKDKLSHVEIVPEIATEPNYEAALAALKAASGA
jgi:thiol peroxidase